MQYYSLTWYRKDGTGKTGAQCFANDAESALRKLKKACIDAHFTKDQAGAWVLNIVNQFNQQIPVGYSK